MKLSRVFYRISRTLGRTSSIITDIETLLTFNPKKITKRAVRKTVNKTSYKIARKINKKFR